MLAPFEAADATISRNRNLSQPSALQFPLDLGNIRMGFKFKPYSYGGTGSFEGGTADIILPIPQNLEDMFRINTGEIQLGAIGATVLDAAQGAMAAGSLGAVYSAGLNKAEEIGRLMGQQVMNPNATSLLGGARLAAYFARSGIDTILPGTGAALDLATGVAVNPHQALNFDGVNLKSFVFQWSLAPQSPAESAALKNIIKKFKQHILPSYENVGGGTSALDRAFLGYPDLVEISLFGLSDYDFQFKPGMISNFTVNYSGQGNVVLAGGKPGIVNLLFTFQEARIHTREDYGGVGGGVSLGSLPSVPGSGSGSDSQEAAASQAGVNVPPPVLGGSRGPI